MRPKDLFKAWDDRGSARLTARQYSIRLPIHVAARIAALCEMYPKKTRTDIIGDLLSTALEGIEAALPSTQSRELPDYDVERKVSDLNVGPKGQFRALTEKYLQELETELDRQGAGEVSAGSEQNS